MGRCWWSQESLWFLYFPGTIRSSTQKIRRLMRNGDGFCSSELPRFPCPLTKMQVSGHAVPTWQALLSETVSVLSIFSGMQSGPWTRITRLFSVLAKSAIFLGATFVSSPHLYCQVWRYMLALNKTELKRPCSDALRCSDSEKNDLESTLILESAGRYHGTVLTFSHFVPRSSLPVRVFESIQKLLFLSEKKVPSVVWGI